MTAWLVEARFELRRRLWGRLRFRASEPRPVDEAGTRAERAFYARVLSLGAPPERRARARLAWDIGCRNWSYARAIADAFPAATLIGVEVDGGRRYWNLHRRGDLARVHARETGRASCFLGDFRAAPARPEHPQAFCFFFPFVSRDPCVGWGLPPRFACFTELLAHAKRIARSPEDWVLSCHQGEWEAELAREAYRAAGFSYRETVLGTEELRALEWPAPHAVHVFFATATQTVNQTDTDSASASVAPKPVFQPLSGSR
jgi:hypothetical protein